MNIDRKKGKHYSWLYIILRLVYLVVAFFAVILIVEFVDYFEKAEKYLPSWAVGLPLCFPVYYLWVFILKTDDFIRLRWARKN